METNLVGLVSRWAESSIARTEISYALCDAYSAGALEDAKAYGDAICSHAQGRSMGFPSLKTVKRWAAVAKHFVGERTSGNLSKIKDIATVRSAILKRHGHGGRAFIGMDPRPLDEWVLSAVREMDQPGWRKIYIDANRQPESFDVGAAEQSIRDYLAHDRNACGKFLKSLGWVKSEGLRERKADQTADVQVQA